MSDAWWTYYDEYVPALSNNFGVHSPEPIKMMEIYYELVNKLCLLLWQHSDYSFMIAVFPRLCMVTQNHVTLFYPLVFLPVIFIEKCIIN